MLGDQLTVPTLSEWRNPPIWDGNDDYMGGVIACKCDCALE